MSTRRLVSLRNAAQLVMVLAWLATWWLLPEAHIGARCAGMALCAFLLAGEWLLAVAVPRLRWTSPKLFHALRFVGTLCGAFGGSLAGHPDLRDLSRPGPLCFVAVLVSAATVVACNLALGERERDLVDDENCPPPPAWRTVPSMRSVPAFIALRGVLSLACLGAWTVAWLALPHLAAGVPGVAAALVWVCGAAGLALDVETLLSRRASDREGAVWRASASVGALILSSLAFPPTSVPLDSAGARAFVVAAALCTAGCLADLVAAVGDGRE